MTTTRETRPDRAKSRLGGGEFLERAQADEQAQGIVRVWTLCDLWLRHLEHRAFPSGYFFTGAFMEYGERRGPLANSLRAVMKTWLKALDRSIQQAQDRKQLLSEPNAEETAFELNALLIGAYWAELAGSGKAYPAARVSVLNRFRSWASNRIASRHFKSLKAWNRYLKAGARRSGV